MAYKYVFDAETCLYKNVCPLYKKDFCNPSCPRYMEMDYLTAHSNIPVNRQQSMFLTPDIEDRPAFIELKEIKDDILNFVNNGENLYIYSKNLGNGKTTWAIKLMMNYFNLIWAGNGFRVRGIFINVPTFLTKIKTIISNPDPEFDKMRDLIADVDLVIWDDIAATKLSEYDYNNLLTYIDQRVLSGKSNIYTGNMGESELVDALGGRLMSRVWNLSIPICFKGSDKRGIR